MQTLPINEEATYGLPVHLSLTAVVAETLIKLVKNLSSASNKHKLINTQDDVPLPHAVPLTSPFRILLLQTTLTLLTHRFHCSFSHLLHLTTLHLNPPTITSALVLPHPRHSYSYSTSLPEHRGIYTLSHSTHSLSLLHLPILLADLSQVY